MSSTVLVSGFSCSVEEHSLSKRFGPLEYAMVSCCIFMGYPDCVSSYVLRSTVVDEFVSIVCLYIFLI